MDIIGILLLIFLGYRNNIRAKRKGQNGLLWAILTIVSYIVFEAIGLYIVIVFFCRGAVDMTMFSRASGGNFQAVSQQFNEQVANALIDKPVRGMLVFLFGIGGYLLIRFILERKPDKKEPEVHWMDKMGEK